MISKIIAIAGYSNEEWEKAARDSALLLLPKEEKLGKAGIKPMTKRQPWFEREFPSGLPAHLLPVVIERLRGTPARLADLLADLPPDQLTWRYGGTWSIQEM